MPSLWRFHVCIIVFCVGFCFGALLFEDSIVQELDASSLQEAVQAAQPLVVNFYAPWCPHCQHFAPEYKEIAEQFADLQVRFGAVNCVEHGSLCRANSIRGYPSVKVWRMGGKEPGSRISNSKDGIVEFVTKAMDKDVQFVKWTDEVFEDSEARLHDAVNSLEFVLRQELPETPEQVAAMRDLLHAAASYLPAHKAARYYELQQTLLRLTSNGQAVSEPLWMAALDSTAPVPVDTDKYQLCEVTDQGGFRFTCGLWQLFHIMSVGASKRFAKDASRKPIELLATIRQFADHLFKCEQCRSHFLEEYDGCNYGRCDLEETDAQGVMLWLWKMHNSVTARVKQDGSSQLWPSIAACMRCRQDNMVTWEEDRVLRYITQSYWSPDWRLLEENTSLALLLLCASALIVAGLLYYGVSQRAYLFAHKKAAPRKDDASRLEEGELARVDRASVVHRRKM